MQDDDAVSMQLVLGYVGLVNSILCLPALIVLVSGGWGGVEGFTLKIFGFILLSALFDDVIADYLWARSVLLTSPTVATVGMSMTIPLAIVTDFLSGLFYGNSPDNSALSAYSLCGAGLVLVGFLFVNVGLEPIFEAFGFQSRQTPPSPREPAPSIKSEYGRINEQSSHQPNGY